MPWAYEVEVAMRDMDYESEHEHYFPLVIDRFPGGYETISSRGACACGLTYTRYVRQQWNVASAVARFLDEQEDGPRS